MAVQVPLVSITGQNTRLDPADTIPVSAVPVMTATVGGGVPTPPNNTTTFLRGDGTFASPSSSSAFPVQLGLEIQPKGISYLHSQTSASTTWNIAHNLDNKYLVVEVIDSLDRVISPLNITFTDINNLVITFSTAITGKSVVVGNPTEPGDIVGVAPLFFSDGALVAVMDTFQ